MILDGWGIAADPTVSAVDLAQTPFMDELARTVPSTSLEASGLAVGLPAGQMGNSEVGHMNLGAGRVIDQELVRIHKAVESESLFEEPVLIESMDRCLAMGKRLHLMGLISNGGVHSHILHLKGLLSMAAKRGLTEVYVHGFTDGRDCDPQSGLVFVDELEAHMKLTTGRIASLCGRYYAMDRDRRWERVKKAYDLLVQGMGTSVSSAAEALRSSYEQGMTDEFVLPVFIKDAFGQAVHFNPGDSVICFNFRTDRGREITEVLTQTAFPEFDMHPFDLHYTTLTRYDDRFVGVHVVFEKDKLENTLGEVLAQAGKTQLRIAETEKYPHVTFFFSGGRETIFEGETRRLCPSPKVATYDLQPEMSAEDIRLAAIEELENKAPDFICLNFANADMVGHTGVMEAAIKACETVDRCARSVAEKAVSLGYAVLVLADHGNADCMRNPDGSPNTAHTTRPVPCHLMGVDLTLGLRNGVLGDVAPTLLALMDIPQPPQMTGQSLLLK